MARRGITKKQGPILPSHSLVASSARYAGTTSRIYLPSQNWQREAYRHFDICPEAAGAARFYGRALGKATLGIAIPKEGGGWETVTTGAEYEDLEALFNGKQGQAQMLESAGVHLTVAGEFYLVGRNMVDEDGVDAGEMWEIVSILEMKVNGNNWTIEYGDQNGQAVKLNDNDTVIRIWRQHPAKRLEADSPFRSLLPTLVQIEWLDKHIFAQTSSRLAGAGILFLPQSITFPPPPTVEGQEQSVPANDAVAFMATLGAYMMAPINDSSKAESLVPIVVMAPDDAIDKVKLQKFWSELDAKALEMRESAIRRFAIGMDLPIEQVLGMSSNSGTGGGNSNGVSHWGAWQIEESTIKMFIEPALELVCQAITISYTRALQPGSRAKVVSETSALRLRPDRSKEATELNQMGVLKEVRMLEENGFTEDDMMDEKEYKRWVLRKLVSGSATPEMVNGALKMLGIDLGITTAPAEPAQPAPQLPQPPSLEDHPVRPRTPDPAESQAASLHHRALVAACESMVLQGLMRAGNRIRSGKNAPTVGDCPAYAVHTQIAINGKADFALEDAFPTAPLVLEGLADPDQIVPVLDAYCKSLFASQEPHTREKLERYLEAGVGS